MTKTKIQLNKLKPSELLRLALDDLRKVERRSKYDVDMSVWYRKVLNDDTCRVCLAGAVIACGHTRFDIKKYTTTDELIDISLSELPSSDDEALAAINYFRVGEVESGLTALGLATKKNLKLINNKTFAKNLIHYNTQWTVPYFGVAVYYFNRTQFYKDMNYLVREFRRVGL